MKHTIPHAPTQTLLSFNHVKNYPGVYVPVGHPNERIICIEGDEVRDFPAVLWMSPSNIQVACEEVWQNKEFFNLNETFSITVNRP